MTIRRGWQACIRLMAGLALAAAPRAAQEPKSGWPKNIQLVLDQTAPLRHSRGGRLPLYLWPAIGPGKLDDARAEELVRLLDGRGVGLIVNWNQGPMEATLAEALPVARAQNKAAYRLTSTRPRCCPVFLTARKRRRISTTRASHSSTIPSEASRWAARSGWNTGSR